jgi:hypothetical protein
MRREPAAALAAAVTPADDDAQELVDYCARPACRQEFRRLLGRGRRQAYCTDLCRRAAERELRQLRSRLAHFDSLVDQLRVDVAAFGHSDREDRTLTKGDDTQRTAELAVARAGGVVAFVRGSEDPLAVELRMLYDAVAPHMAPNEAS